MTGKRKLEIWLEFVTGFPPIYMLTSQCYAQVYLFGTKPTSIYQTVHVHNSLLCVDVGKYKDTDTLGLNRLM